MCDTLVARGTEFTWLAKNSDRDPLEAQRVDVVPAVRGDNARRLRCTWIDVAQVPNRYGCIIGRPAWMWGAEMGVNDCGLAIGNEAIFSRKVRRSGVALLGMDLLRLALERADTADNALQVMVDLLEQYGQGGPAGYTQKNFRYDNSFLIADKASVWKLETAGSYWAAERVETVESISNALTIGSDFQRSDARLSAKPLNFRRHFDTWLVPFVGASHRRRNASLNALRQFDVNNVGFADFARLLRSHRHNRPSGNGDLCMHAASAHSPLKFLRPSQTVNSMIVRLGSDGPKVAFTGTPSACGSLFKPVGFSGGGSVCEPDLWERHKVWLDQQNFTNKSREQLAQKIEDAEREIFAKLESGQLETSEKIAQRGIETIFNNRIADSAQPEPSF
jgi:secernin